MGRPVEVRVLLAAPFAYKTTNFFVVGRLTSDCGGERGFLANYPYPLVFDLDRQDYRPEIGFAGLDIPILELFRD
ncbi:MAG: hypothetical protein EBT35_04585 [Alphaproteobacteria bacterium]|nr:hypothetical protein [Alphaproteobacteria bacterium]